MHLKEARVVFERELNRTSGSNDWWKSFIGIAWIDRFCPASRLVMAPRLIDVRGIGPRKRSVESKGCEDARA